MTLGFEAIDFTRRLEKSIWTGKRIKLHTLKIRHLNCYENATNLHKPLKKNSAVMVSMAADLRC